MRPLILQPKKLRGTVLSSRPTMGVDRSCRVALVTFIIQAGPRVASSPTPSICPPHVYLYLPQGVVAGILSELISSLYLVTSCFVQSHNYWQCTKTETNTFYTRSSIPRVCLSSHEHKNLQITRFKCNTQLMAGQIQGNLSALGTQRCVVSKFRAKTDISIGDEGTLYPLSICHSRWHGVDNLDSSNLTVFGQHPSL